MLRDRWRWALFDRTLTLDPAALPRPVAAPGPLDFIICGAPRTGTTFLCAVLFQPPQLVTVMQPWDGLRLPVAELFRSLRREIDKGVMGRGRLDLDALRTEGSIRVVEEGERQFRLETADDYLLGVKWPVFWRYLELLGDTKFLVCVRSPAEVVDSYVRMSGNPGGRRLSQGFGNPNGFNRPMNRYLRRTTRDPARRRIEMFDYHYSRLLPLLDRPNVFVVRHERWFVDPDALVSEIGAFLGVPLGRGFPAVRRRPSPSSIREADRGLVFELSTTAAALGYRAGDDTAEQVAR